MAAPHLDTVLRHIRKLAAGRGSPKRTDRQLLEISLPAVTRQPLPLSLPVTDRWSTFLILARNIGSIRKRAALAEWLHGVAYRTAMKAKRSAARRRNHEARLASTAKTVPSPSWDDVQAVLDQEIQRLPKMFRAALLLGHTFPEQNAMPHRFLRRFRMPGKQKSR